MQTNILWTGQRYHSTEHCILTENAVGNEIVSTIIGYSGGKIYKVDYEITTNEAWELRAASLKIQCNNKKQVIRIERGEDGVLLNGVIVPEYSDVKDIDISLTPFTNTLPINRLKLVDNEKQVIQVLYFDILEKEIKPVKQVYTKLGVDLYRYENFDKSFSADIRVDEQGLVSHYPGLFDMEAKKKSYYF